MSPSIAEEVIPPAYPAPSPLGNIPAMFDSSVCASRTIRITAELRASSAISRAFGSQKPLIFLSRSRSAFFSALVINSGRQEVISVICTPGR